MRIALVYRGFSPYAQRIARSLERAGHEVHEIVWDMKLGASHVAVLPDDRTHVLERPASGGAGNALRSGPFARFVRERLGGIRPDAVHAINEDAAVLAAPAKGRSYRFLICDVRDSVADRSVSRNPIVRVIATAIKLLAIRASSALVVPDARRATRMGRAGRRAILVANTPDVDPAQYAGVLPDGPPKVFLSGAISEAKGLGVLLAALDGAHGVQVLAAGFASDTLAERVLGSHPRIEFVGMTSPNESLALAARCDAILCYYRPVRMNDVLASPSKLMDALAVGRPVLVNSEVEVSEWVAAHRLGHCVAFDDVEGLSASLRGLEGARAALPEFRRRSVAAFESEFSWPLMEGRLHELYATLEETR
jgi:glycosyltransferase involved in cell wall biosynthesis